MPELQIYEDASFPSDLNWQAVSFMRVEWPWINGGMFKQTHAAERNPRHFALVEEGLLLSYATVIHTHLTHAHVEYTVCGLGSVFTYPACRSKGYGRLIVDAATRSIEQSSADLGLLFCQPALEGFYAKSGWQAFKDTPLFLDSLSQESASLKMMLFLSEKAQAGRAAFETLPLYVLHGR